MKRKKKIVYNTVYKCDRCGKEYNYIQGILKLKSFDLSYPIWRHNRYSTHSCKDIFRIKFDLCNDCSKKLYNFINNENEELI